MFLKLPLRFDINETDISLEEFPKLLKQLISPMEFSGMKMGLIASHRNFIHYIILGKDHNDWACGAKNTFF